MEKLEDDKLYKVSILIEWLGKYNLPHSIWWVRKAEKMGLIPRPMIGTSRTRWYTGKLIKKIISDLISTIK